MLRNLSFPILVFLSFFSYSQDSLELYNLDLSLKKAKVATFYSAATANGKNEIELAKKYTDSLEYFINNSTLDEKKLILYDELLNALRDEHSISESIAKDNINYIYPSSSLISGHRTDFIIKDDAEEQLVESLIEKVLLQYDPLNKGLIKENIDYVVFQIIPFNQTIFQVASDFMSSETGHYVIRPHEFTEILNEDGFKRLKNDELSIDDWQKLFDNYGADKILNLKVVDQGSVIPNIYYKGVFINSVEKGMLPNYVAYFENFKFDKANSHKNGILLLIINFILTLVALIVMSSFKLRKGDTQGDKKSNRKFEFKINSDTIKETFLIGFISITSVTLVQLLGIKFLSPSINAFYQESSVRLWIFFQLFIPFISSLIITYFTLFKLPKIIVNNSQGYSRIMFGSLMAQISLLSYYKYHSKFNHDNFYSFIEIIPVVILILLCNSTGQILNRIVKGDKTSIAGYSFLFIGTCSIFLSFWLEFKEIDSTANISYLFLGILSITTLLKSEILTKKTFSNEQNLSKSNLGLSNPENWFKKGLNVDLVQNNLIDFISSENAKSRLFILKGLSGSGKTRLLKETLKVFSTNDHPNNIRWFQGDCNQVFEGNPQLYEPFYEAFSLNGELTQAELPASDRCLPKGFFTDRSQISKIFGKVISKAGSVAQLELEELISVDDESSRSIEEIVSELIELLIERFVQNNNSKIIICIDDFHWIDQASLDLFKLLYLRSKDRPKYSKYFKFILTITTDQETTITGKTISNLIEDVTTIDEDNIKSSILEDEIVVEDVNIFIKNILSETEYKIEKFTNSKFRFGPSLKGHLTNKINLINTKVLPGDFFSYLDLLDFKKFIKFDNQVIRLIAEPNQEEVNFQDSKKHIFESSFKKLSTQHQSLLQSASIIGFKFDAELLAVIWKKDLIEILSELEDLEGDFVKDLNNEDNIYSFANKTMYKLIIESANKNKSESESRQLIIEYQKRIIQSIVEKKEIDYAESLDLDVLLSASERCFKYSNIKYINDHAPEIVLQTCKKLAIKGKRDQCVNYLRRLYAGYGNFSSDELLLIAQTLMELTKINRKTEEFEFKRDNDKETSFLDYIFLRARQNVKSGIKYKEDAFSLISVVIMGGIMQFLRNLSKNHPNVSIENFNEIIVSNNLEILNVERIIPRYELIKSLINNNQISDDMVLSRLSFYNYIIKNSDPSALPNLFKNALKSGYIDLAGEISRELYLNSKFGKKLKLKYLFASLELLSGSEVKIEGIENYKVDKDSVKKSIDKLIKSKNLKSGEAQNLNILISRFREYFFHELKDYNYVIELCEITFELSKRVNDRIGKVLSFSYKGASLFKNKNFEESILTYQLYFEEMIRTSRNIEDFLYPLEGLLRNAKQNNNYSVYEMAKKELYEHLIILEKSVIDKKLKHSLFDNQSRFSNLLKNINLTEDIKSYVEFDESNFTLSKDIVVILVSMASADGIVDDNEKYDLTEACIAISHSLNLPRKNIYEAVEVELKNSSNQSFQKTKTLFIEACKNVIEKKSEGYLESVIQLCYDIAKADKQLDENEKRLIDNARKLLEPEHQ